ncbi:MAG: bifunctional folylpolyglutamate synthase/dihydrofolate synthase [Actinobacteria bacterium]|nr:bifunctional folylpolyglutamate synthase/dihydrofolate synthase [Actinomycetota bacterium]
MDFDEAVADLQQRGSGRMIPDLDRITRIAELLGNPERSYPTIHITGTNGKTSVTRTVTALCSAAGLSAGTYTSPHLQTIRERLSVAGRRIGETTFAEVYADLRPLLDLVDSELEDPRDSVTYFEALTAMAYWWFADKPVDLGVFEVGMGGRWDATNLVRGDVAVLTPIDVDHRELGATPVEIAGEKVGIIKEGSVVVSARQRDDVLAVIRRAVADADATLLLEDEDFGVVSRTVAVGGQVLTLRVGERTVEDVLLPLFGEYQASNAAISLAAFAAFTGDGFATFGDDLLRQGFGAVTVPGRLEIVHREPTVVLDGAHNPHGARAAAEAIAGSFEFRNLILVIGALADKDLAGILRAYRGVASHVVVTTPPSARGASLEQMLEAAVEVWEETGVVVEAADSVAEALEKAAGVAGVGDGVLVTGSLYVVGAARDVYLPVDDAGDEVVYEPGDLDDDEDEAEFNAALERMLDRVDDDRGPDDDAP